MTWYIHAANIHPHTAEGNHGQRRVRARSQRGIHAPAPRALRCVLERAAGKPEHTGFLTAWPNSHHPRYRAMSSLVHAPFAACGNCPPLLRPPALSHDLLQTALADHSTVSIEAQKEKEEIKSSVIWLLAFVPCAAILQTFRPVSCWRRVNRLSRRRNSRRESFGGT
ncbi:unnamed protein product [Periconia digitata]|uniref:Uncharacterized protein n=1 Tax=Periconia digitata TaxID=1303443 RepID=A0A9W4XDC2_9PLEO|nr:unnamed protein product [Periconia digitata]